MVEELGIGAFGRARGRRAPTIARRWKRLGPGRAVAGCVTALWNDLLTRLVRVGFLVVIPAFLAFLLSISTTGALRDTRLIPCSTASPQRRSQRRWQSTTCPAFPAPKERRAAGWYRETIASLGLRTEEDVWTADLADLGTVELRNVVSVVPGRSEQAIVPRCSPGQRGSEQVQGENASGTATLIELARGSRRRTSV